MMTDDHWLNRCFEGQRCSRSRRPEIAMSSESHVTAVYVKSEYNTEDSQPLEAEERDEEEGKELNEPEDQVNSTLKPSARLPNVDNSKFPPRPGRKLEPIQTKFPPSLQPGASAKVPDEVPIRSAHFHNHPQPGRIVNGYLYPPSIRTKGGSRTRSNTPNSFLQPQRWSTQDPKSHGGPTLNRTTNRPRAIPLWKQQVHPGIPGISPKNTQPNVIPGIPHKEDTPQDHHEVSSLRLGSRSFGGFSQPAPYQPGRDNPQPPGGYPHSRLGDLDQGSPHSRGNQMHHNTKRLLMRLNG
jgi:hypothetical protein